MRVILHFLVMYLMMVVEVLTDKVLNAVILVQLYIQKQ